MATILVVEDAPSQLELINSFLRDRGHTVIKAYDAKDGMSKAIIYRLDAIITNVIIPEISGFEFCRQMQKLASVCYKVLVYGREIIIRVVVGWI
ncbi:response regulator transcription factor [uncultured Nostoc sp.]|uniref:response regulator transcription factor n=1 Tax=uncultured Nostoc sp. TaxID=340711 RepID=UPI0035CA62B8